MTRSSAADGADKDFIGRSGKINSPPITGDYPPGAAEGDGDGGGYTPTNKSRMYLRKKRISLK